MKKTRTRTVDSPIGMLTLCSDGTAITGVHFGDEQGCDTDEILDWAERELAAYFSGEAKAFTVPVKTEGTPFQQKVWAALCAIPYGETASYSQIADQIGHPRACRAVGMANHVNRVPIIIPCHRVIGANGKLTGYAGGVEVKQKLLEIERERNG